MFNEAKFRTILLPSSGNVNDYVAYVHNPLHYLMMGEVSFHVEFKTFIKELFYILYYISMFIIVPVCIIVPWHIMNTEQTSENVLTYSEAEPNSSPAHISSRHET